MPSRHLLILFAAFLLSCASASAETLYLKARLLPQAGVTSNGDGAGLFTYDTVSRSLSWTVTYRNLSSAVAGAHLHGPALPDQTAPIVVPMPVSASPLSGNATITAPQESELLAGLWYVNLHTATYGDGEIRGQIEVIDTTRYTVSTGVPAASSSFIAGTIDVDFATLQVSWNVNWGAILNHIVTSTDFHGPAKGTEVAPVTVPAPGHPSIGTATLTPSQVADVVNGFWYFVVNDVNGAYRAYVYPGDPHLVNISTRVEVEAGEAQAIAGFVLDGGKWVQVKVSGPSLASFGIASPLMNPKVTLVRMSDNAIVAENDDWQAFQGGTFYPNSMPDPREPSMVVFLPGGAYTAIVSSSDGGTGVALVAAYEVSNPETAFINISTRGMVRTGEQVMIAGFVVGGDHPKTFVVRGLGPSLIGAGLRNPLPNPLLQLVRQADGVVIAVNDDWQSAANAADIQASGFAPGDSLEAAILVTLAPGAYTAILTGQGGATGIGIVEVYAVSD